MQIADIYAYFVRETAITFELEPPSHAEILERVRLYANVGPWIVAEHDQEIFGYAYVSPFRARPAYRFSAEVTVYLKHDCGGRGLGRALYTSLFACMKMQGFVTAIGGITLPNIPSVKLHEKMGMRQTAVFHNVGYKFGQWHDVGFWDIKLNSPLTPMPELLKPAALDQHPDWLHHIRSGESTLHTHF